MPSSRVIDVIAPAPGELHPLADVPDPVFAQGMAGAGAALWLEEGEYELVAPAGGIIRTAKGHGCVVDAGGVGILLHLGIDSLHCEESGIALAAHAGDAIAPGKAMGTWNTAIARASGLDPWLIIVAMGYEGEVCSLARGAWVNRGDLLFSLPIEGQ